MVCLGKNWNIQSEQRHRATTLYAQELEGVLMNYALRSGIFVCIILDEPNEDELLRIAQKAWKLGGLYRIYYLSRHRQVFYNPFGLNGRGNFGTLGIISKININRTFKNLNQYPLRIYIFDSVYSVINGDPETKQVTEIKGADSKCAILLRDWMNFTMELQWPDDTFFG